MKIEEHEMNKIRYWDSYLAFWWQSRTLNNSSWLQNLVKTMDQGWIKDASHPILTGPSRHLSVNAPWTFPGPAVLPLLPSLSLFLIDKLPTATENPAPRSHLPSNITYELTNSLLFKQIYFSSLTTRPFLP